MMTFVYVRLPAAKARAMERNPRGYRELIDGYDDRERIRHPVFELDDFLAYGI